MNIAASNFALGNVVAVRRRASRPGFTLIELILAMGLAAILATTLYISMKVAFNATESSDRAIEPARTSDLAFELIAADLQNAVAPNTTITNAQNIYDLDSPGATVGASSSSSTSSASSTAGTSGTSSAASNAAPAGWVLAGPFEGTQTTMSGGNESDDLIFFTNSDSPQHPDANGEIKMVELKLDQPQGATDLCLVRRVTGNLTTESPLNMDEEILCRGVNSLMFEYFDGSDWNTTWDSTMQDNTIPVAVRMTIKFNRALRNGTEKTYTFTRVFTLAASTAAQDTNVNPNVGAN